MSNTDQGAPAPASSPTNTPSSITQPSSPTAEEVLAFDPFAPPATPTPAPESGTPGGTGTPAEVPAAPKPGEPLATPGQQPATPATPAQVSPQDLQRILQEQTAVIREAVAPKKDPAVTPTEPKYNLAIPPQILTGLRSEDQTEFAQSFHAVVNGVANKVWGDVQEAISAQVMPMIGQVVQSHIQAYRQQAEVAQDFYGSYPHLAIPALRPIIQAAGVAAAQRRAAEGKPLAWDESLRNDIAEEVYKSVPQLRQQAAPVPTPAKPNGRKPFVAGGGTRPAGTGEKTPADEMAELVKG